MDWDSYARTGMLEAEPEFDTVPAGAVKDTYIVHSDSDSYVLQTVEPGSEYRLHKQRELYDRLAETDVPVPEVLHDNSSETVPYQVVEHVGGDNLRDDWEERSRDEAVELAEEAGSYLGAAHTAMPEDRLGRIYGTEDGLRFEGGDDPREECERLIGNKLEYMQGGPVDRDGLGQELEIALDEALEDVPVDRPTVIMHRDYGPDNLQADETITGVLDWDNAMGGDPYYDYVKAEGHFTHHFEDGEKRETVRDAFRDGYSRRAGDLMDDDLYQTYRFFAMIDKAAGLTYVIQEGWDIEDETIDLVVESLQERMETVR